MCDFSKIMMCVREYWSREQCEQVCVCGGGGGGWQASTSIQHFACSQFGAQPL